MCRTTMDLLRGGRWTRIVQMHGGTLTAADDPGGGACFRVAIPRA